MPIYAVLCNYVHYAMRASRTQENTGRERFLNRRLLVVLRIRADYGLRAGKGSKIPVMHGL